MFTLKIEEVIKNKQNDLYFVRCKVLLSYKVSG